MGGGGIALPQGQRIHVQVQLVDQVVCEQRMHQLAAPVRTSSSRASGPLPGYPVL